jgi:hypothetical protein
MKQIKKAKHFILLTGCFFTLVFVITSSSSGKHLLRFTDAIARPSIMTGGICSRLMPILLMVSQET